MDLMHSNNFVVKSIDSHSSNGNTKFVKRERVKHFTQLTDRFIPSFQLFNTLVTLDLRRIAIFFIKLTLV